MKLISPDYYTLFSCIGSRCRNNCCIGWEIDIDDFTLSYYRSLNGLLGQKLNNSISVDEDGAHFILSDDERCPFLDSDGLCALIKEIGEDALCDICADHPRFRNFLSDRVEIGIGLACEEAARIIVTNEKDVSFIVLEDDGCGESLSLSQMNFLSERQKLFSLLNEANKSFSCKISDICSQYNISPFEKISEWTGVFKELEHLTSQWPQLLQNVADAGVNLSDIFSENKYDKYFENLLHYFILRHFIYSDSCEEKRLAVGASVLSVCIIAAVFYVSGDLSVDSLIGIARLYSSETEYSDVNFEYLMDAIRDERYV